MDERQELVQKLEFIGEKFARFEKQYNLVKSLPRNKQVVFSDKNQSTIKMVTSGTSFVGFAVLGAFLMLIPTIFISCVVGLLKTGRFDPDVATAILGWFVLTFLFAKSKAKKMSKKAGNKLAQHNSKAAVHNVDVDRQIAIAEQNCQAIRNEITQLDLSWYPPSYSYSQAAYSFANYIKNFRANNMQEAVNLFEEDQYRTQMTDLQRQQVSLQKQQLVAAWTQCILQCQTIGAINNQGAMTRTAINNQGAMTRNAINNQTQTIKNMFSRW